MGGKLQQGVTLSPEAVEVLRRLIAGDTSDRSPTIREVQRAIEECACTERDRLDLLLVLGLEEENAHSHSTHSSFPGRRKTE